MLIPFQRGNASYRLLDVKYHILEFANDSTDAFTSRQGSVDSGLPLFETYNEGVYQKQSHAALRVNITREIPDRDYSYQVMEHVRFRVYKNSLTQAVDVASIMSTTTPLSSGVWYKIPIHRSGVFRLNRTYLATLTGLNVATLDPRRIQIWAGSNAMLPMANSTARPEFKQVPIIVTGESDGRFDTDDAVLFYAEGPQRAYYDVNLERFVHETHLYASQTFVFITVANENGLRLSPATPGNPDQVLTSFTDFLFKEEELNKITTEMRSGSEWLGERVTAESFGNTLTMIDTVLAGFIPNSTVVLNARLATRNRGNATFTTSLGSQVIGTLNLGGLDLIYNTEDSDFGYAQNQFLTIPNVTLQGNRLQITSRYASVTPNEALGYLDFARVYVQRNLATANGRLTFYSPSSTAANAWATYRISGFTASPIVLDVTNPQTPVQYNATASGGNWDVVAPSSPGRRLMAVNQYWTPEPAISASN